MAKRIIIDPVSRIEGHAKITIYLDDADQVTDARFHVTEFRGFEKILRGPALLGDGGAERPHLRHLPGQPSAGVGQGRRPHLERHDSAGRGQAAPPHESRPDRPIARPEFLPSERPRSAPGLGVRPGHAQCLRPDDCRIPDLARGGIRLRQFGQEIIEALGGRKIHPAWGVPGGVRDPLGHRGPRPLAAASARDVQRPPMSPWISSRSFWIATRRKRRPSATSPACSWAWSVPSGDWENYDGHLRFTDHTGKIIAECDDMSRYQEFIGEAVEKDSFLKSPYYRPLGYPDGVYRVGPLARLNICKAMGHPQADKELAEFRQRGHGTPNASFYFHYARLIEILAGLEGIERLLDDPELQSDRLRAQAGINQLEGVGVSEAPARDFVSPLPSGRKRPVAKDQLDHRHRAKQPGHEQDRRPDRQEIHQGPAHSRTRAQPRGSRHSRLRPLLELFHARLRPNAFASAVG